MARTLTDTERIEARHWLQVLAEHALSARNALDPRHGLLAITDHAWDAQWHSLKRDLDSFTQRVMENRPSPGNIRDRNA